jgi:small subunit ribosomal protein S24e
LFNRLTLISCPIISQVVDVIHPGRANVSKKELRSLLAKMYNVADEATVSLFGFRTQFGGGKSSGFCLIYDNISALNKYEPKYRLLRVCFCHFAFHPHIRPPCRAAVLHMPSWTTSNIHNLVIDHWLTHHATDSQDQEKKPEKSSRKQRKERKNRAKKLRGVKKSKVSVAKK